MSKTFKQEKGKRVTSVSIGCNCRIDVYEKSNPTLIGMLFDAAQRMKEEGHVQEKPDSKSK